MAESKGERRSVSRKTCNAMRLERKKMMDVDAELQSRAAKDMVLARKGGGEETNKLKDKYMKEDSEHTQACRLQEQYADAGVTWGACMQAVKTDWVPSFHNVWGLKLKNVRGNEQKKTKDYSAVD